MCVCFINLQKENVSISFVKEELSTEIHVERLRKKYDTVSCDQCEIEDEKEKKKENLQKLKDEVEEHENQLRMQQQSKQQLQTRVAKKTSKSQKVQRKLADIAREKTSIEEGHQNATDEQRELLEESSRKLSDNQVSLTSKLENLEEEAKDKMEVQNFLENSIEEREKMIVSCKAKISQLEFEMAQREEEEELRHYEEIAGSFISGSERHMEMSLPSPTAGPDQVIDHPHLLLDALAKQRKMKPVQLLYLESRKQLQSHLKKKAVFSWGGSCNNKGRPKVDP